MAKLRALFLVLLGENVLCCNNEVLLLTLSVGSYKLQLPHGINLLFSFFGFLVVLFEGLKPVVFGPTCIPPGGAQGTLMWCLVFLRVEGTHCSAQGMLLAQCRGIL